MPDLNLYTSNRLEILARFLADLLKTPLSSPLKKEIIVVQSKGMEHWLSMQLAKFHGICANIDFPFPITIVFQIMSRIIGTLPDRSLFDPNVMTWKIMKLLPSFLAEPPFKDLQNYLEGADRNLKLFQLSAHIADTFDQYMIFRPDMILNWETGQEDLWQAELWRAIAKETQGMHRAALRQKLNETNEQLLQDISQDSALPERISVFGISALPPFHMEIFEKFSKFMDVHLFLMNPCKECWEAILPDISAGKIADKRKRPDLSAEELYLERGNSLLASMGTLGRDFFYLVNQLNPVEISAFEDPGQDTLLHTLQSDILDLRDRERDPEGKKIILDDDTSIRIHSCHSPMREMEVLRDNLLDLFQNNPELLPGDILVMTPDIEAYAPYIQAVFDLTADEPHRIPFYITDQNLRRESEIIPHFLALLELPFSRFYAPHILDLLESQHVRRKFDLNEKEVERIHTWVQGTRIRWGIDQKHRNRLGLPSCSENTWSAGLDRLLLGYAMPGKEVQQFRDILPYDHVEGSDGLILGKLLEFTGLLFSYSEQLDLCQTLEKWHKTLKQMLDSFFLADESSEREMQILRDTLKSLADMQAMTQMNENLDIRVVQSYIKHELERSRSNLGFIVGGVTFCAMLPMRSIPFKVIYIAGMNVENYPRQSRPLGFDLMAANPMRGDRSRRNDDRYLFLEAILSAREKLIISYVGSSIQDNTPIPPSVLVSELLDAIEQGFDTTGHNILDSVVTNHRLQAFNPDYFNNNSSLFSYSKENCKAARHLISPRKDPSPFISNHLSEPDDEFRNLDIHDLCKFFNHPTRYLFNRRLKIRFEQFNNILEEKESFEIKGLDRYTMGEELVKHYMEGRNLLDLMPIMKASGRLPHGSLGECEFKNICSDLSHFMKRTSSCLGDTPLKSMHVDLELEGYRLTGDVQGITDTRRVQFRYARVKAKDHLSSWILHLILNACIQGSAPRTTVLIALNKKNKELVWTAWEFSPVENSRKILKQLLLLYWEGMKRPLLFFPETSMEYARQILLKDKSGEYALCRALDVWDGDDYNPGEGQDDYYQRCYSAVNPFDETFQLTAVELFRPFFDHQEELSYEGI